MNLKKIINLFIKIISYISIILSFLGIIKFVFFRYNTIQHSNPEVSSLQITILGFFFIFSFGFLVQIIKKRKIGLYGYFVVSALGLIIGLAGRYSNLLSVSKFSLVFSLVIVLLSLLNKNLYSEHFL